MLPVTANHPPTRRSVFLCLFTCGVLTCALPTLRSAVTHAQQQQAGTANQAKFTTENRPALSLVLAGPQRGDREASLAEKSEDKNDDKAASSVGDNKKEPDAAEFERRSHHNLLLLHFALHDYHDAHKSFPARANYDSAGKPLLSWRVHLLPYLGQKKLYRQFRLNEPWDSPHNRRLVVQIPSVYKVPLRKPLAKGKTCYLVPTGEGTLFDGKQAPSIGDCRDGISYTLILVEADRRHAVPWTKPQDITIDATQPRKGLTGHRQGGFLALFVEGTSALIPKRLKYKSSGKQLDDETNADALRCLFQPAEDFATGMVTYRNPETGHLVKSQFTVSWMFDKQGLRLALDGIGPGYAFEMNSLRSPLEVFIGDAAASSTADAETALEKSQASRGLLTVQPNEPDLYGYPDENADAVAAFTEGRAPLLDWQYGLEIVRLTMAAYLSAERRSTVDLTDPATRQELETYVPLIQQGRGGEVLEIQNR